MLENLTLVVPTYYRQSYALRLMNYWSGRGPKLIVIDGTENPIYKSHLEGFDSSIMYIHNPVGFYERLRGALDLITTKYVALAGDDEFYIPSALANCIRELEKDRGLVACSGVAIGFCPERDFVRGVDVYPKLRGYGAFSESPEERVLAHMSDYEVNQIYAICRSKEWRIIFREILNREFSVFAISEYQFELYMSFAGRSKVLGELMWLRNMGETNPIRGTDSSLGTVTFDNWFENTLHADERAELLHISAHTLCKLSSQHTYESSRNLAEAGYIAFYGWLKSQRTTQNLVVRQYVAEFLKNVLPPIFSQFAIYFKKKSKFIRWFRKNRDKEIRLMQLAKEFEANYKIKISIKELSEIERILVSSRADHYFRV